MNTAVTDARFEQIVAQVFPKPPAAASKGAHAGHERRVETVRRVYDTSPTIGAFRGTGWGTVNAVNEWEAWSTRAISSKRSAKAFRERHLLRVVENKYPATAQTLALVRGE